MQSQVLSPRLRLGILSRQALARLEVRSDCMQLQQEALVERAAACSSSACILVTALRKHMRPR
jgi:hypothetical protein